MVTRQLDLFLDEHADLVEQTEAALRAYDAGPADGAEERYERFLDLADTGRDELAEVRDAYARTLDPATAEEYEATFNVLVRRRLPRFGLEIED